jgi:hypothetical protein
MPTPSHRGETVAEERRLGGSARVPAHICRWVRLLGELAGQLGARAGLHQNRQSGCVPRDLSELQPMHDRVVSWAESVPEVRAIALVGSWARGEARADSDVDLIVLALSPETLVSDTSWTAFVGPSTLVTVEEWGAISSVRVRYANGQEVEFGIGSVAWAETSPVDPGTRRVVGHGFLPLHSSAVVGEAKAIGSGLRRRAGTADLRSTSAHRTRAQNVTNARHPDAPYRHICTRGPRHTERRFCARWVGARSCCYVRRPRSLSRRAHPRGDGPLRGKVAIGQSCDRLRGEGGRGSG